MKVRLLVAATLTMAVVLALTSASGFAHARVAKTRIAIRDTGAEGVFIGKFTLALNNVAFDSGKGQISPAVGDNVIRDGQTQEPVSGSDLLTGKKGTLRVQFEGVAIEVATNRFAEYGTWKLEQLNTAGAYKHWTGGGRWASVEVNNRYYVEWDGLVTH